MNNFREDLIYSLEKNYDKEMSQFYFDKFPHLQKVEIVDNIDMQKRGIDKILIFDSGKEAFVDEKKRRKDYGDILLEEYSDFDNKKIGWMGRDKYTDYIVYIIEPTKTIYLLPFLILQCCWLKNYNNWLEKYGRLFAQNNGYRTSNIPIPTQILFDSIKEEISHNSITKDTINEL